MHAHAPSVNSLPLLQEVVVCLHCGDRGFQETLVFSTNCKAYALHTFLMSTPSLCFLGCTSFSCTSVRRAYVASF